MCMVTRLTTQKGIDLIIDAFDDFLIENFLLVIIGSGDSRFEEFFRTRKGKQLGVCIGFD